MNLTSYGLGVALVLVLPALSNAQTTGKPSADREPMEISNPPATANAAPAAATATAGPPAEGQVRPDACYLEYERADNGWAAAGRPDGDLGREYIILAKGQYKNFNTNWANEKRRGTGMVSFGSHLRRATNQGVRLIEVYLQTSPATSHIESLKPGLAVPFRADLKQVRCPA